MTPGFGKALRERYRRPTRKPESATPMSQSLNMLRKLGFQAYAVEHRPFIPDEHGQQKVDITRDLLGFADILALGDKVVLLVQTTTATHVSTRIRKIKGLATFDYAKRAGMRIEVHGWGDGGVRVVDITNEPTEWSDVVKNGKRAKNRPRTQTMLALEDIPHRVGCAQCHAHRAPDCCAINCWCRSLHD